MYKNDKLCRSIFLGDLIWQRFGSKEISSGKWWAYSNLLKNVGTSRSLRMAEAGTRTEEDALAQLRLHALLWGSYPQGGTDSCRWDKELTNWLLVTCKSNMALSIKKKIIKKSVCLSNFASYFNSPPFLRRVTCVGKTDYMSVATRKVSILNSLVGESIVFYLRTKSFVVFTVYRQSIATEEPIKERQPFITFDKNC